MTKKTESIVSPSYDELQQEYISEFEVIDGVSMHRDGLNFEQWKADRLSKNFEILDVGHLNSKYRFPIQYWANGKIHDIEADMNEVLDQEYSIGSIDGYDPDERNVVIMPETLRWDYERDEPVEDSGIRRTMSYDDYFNEHLRHDNYILISYLKTQPV